MRTFTNQNVISTVKRLTYSGTPSKGVFTTVGTNLNGYLRPLSEEVSAANNMQWGFGFTLITEVGIDIKIADIITINSQDYTVKGFANHNRGYRTQYQKYLIIKSQA